MFNLLEKLRAQSKGYRTFIAFVLALSLTGVIFVFWLSAQKGVKVAPEVSEKVTSYTPVDTLSKSIREAWVSVQQTVTEFSTSLKTVDLSNTVEYQSGASSTVPKANP